METLKTVIEFVNSGTNGQISPKTGDSILFLAIMTIIICIAGAGILFLQKQKSYAKIGKRPHAANSNSTKNRWNIGTIVFSAVIAFSVIFAISSLCVNKAIADDASTNKVPETIKATVDENTGAVKIEDGFIQNTNTDGRLLFKSVKITKTETDGDCKYTLNIDGNEIFNDKAGVEKTFDKAIAIDDKKSFNISTDMNPDIAKSFIGKSPIAIEYVLANDTPAKDEEKSKASAEVETMAKESSTTIESLNLNAEDKAEFEKQIKEIADKTNQAVKEAKWAYEVEQAKEQGEKEIQKIIEEAKVKSLNNTKKEAAAEVDTETEKAAKEIEINPNLFEEDIKTFKEEIEAAKLQAKNDIENAKTEEEAINCKKELENTIAKIMSSAVEQAKKNLVNSKTNANKKINEDSASTKEQINILQLPKSIKKKAESEIDTLSSSYQTKIETKESIKDVNEAVEEFNEKIIEISNKYTEEAKKYHSADTSKIDIEHGTFEIDTEDNLAKEGNTVTITYKPNEGESYTIKTVNVTTVDNGIIPVEIIWNIAKFIMPSKPIIIDLKEAQAFDIVVNDDGHGKASASQPKAIEGTTITLSATPDKGYEFDKWESEDVEISKENTFTMPAQDVSIKAIFKEDIKSIYTATIDPNGGSVTNAPEDWKQCATIYTHYSGTKIPGYINFYQAEIGVNIYYPLTKCSEEDYWKTSIPKDEYEEIYNLSPTPNMSLLDTSKVYISYAPNLNSYNDPHNCLDLTERYPKWTIHNTKNIYFKQFIEDTEISTITKEWSNATFKKGEQEFDSFDCDTETLTSDTTITVNYKELPTTTYTLETNGNGSWLEGDAEITEIKVVSATTPTAGETISYYDADGQHHSVKATPDYGYKFAKCTFENNTYTATFEESVPTHKLTLKLDDPSRGTIKMWEHITSNPIDLPEGYMVQSAYHSAHKDWGQINIYADGDWESYYGGMDVEDYVSPYTYGYMTKKIGSGEETKFTFNDVFYMTDDAVVTVHTKLIGYDVILNLDGGRVKNVPSGWSPLVGANNSYKDNVKTFYFYNENVRPDKIDINTEPKTTYTLTPCEEDGYAKTDIDLDFWYSIPWNWVSVSANDVYLGGALPGDCGDNNCLHTYNYEINAEWETYFDPSTITSYHKTFDIGTQVSAIEKEWENSIFTKGEQVFDKFECKDTTIEADTTITVKYKNKDKLSLTIPIGTVSEEYDEGSSEMIQVIKFTDNMTIYYSESETVLDWAKNNGYTVVFDAESGKYNIIYDVGAEGLLPSVLYNSDGKQGLLSDIKLDSGFSESQRMGEFIPPFTTYALLTYG